METSGSSPGVTQEDVRSVFSSLDEPSPPLTVGEVAEKLECTNQTAQHNLETLAECGELQTKQIDGQSLVWWRPGDGSGSAGQQPNQKEFNRFVSAVRDYAIFMLDPQGTIISWNDGAERIKGYAETEILGEHLSTFYTDAETDDGVPDTNLEAAAAEGRIEDKGWRVRKDGSRFWANVVITAVRNDDGTLQGFTKVTRDMTEQQAYEQQLRQERDFSEQILETSPTGILVVDTADEITRANNRAKELLGRPVEKFTDHFFDAGEGTLSIPTGNPLLESGSVVERVRTTGDAVFGVEGRLKHPDRDSIWLSINAAPLDTDESDEPTKIVVAFEDITDRKETTSALERLNNITQTLMTADRQEIVNNSASFMQRVLDVEYAGMWGYDSDSGELRLHAENTTLADHNNSRYPDDFDERAWQAFISDDSDVSSDLPPPDDITPAESPIRSGVIVPLSRHGIIYAGATQPNTFDDATTNLAEMVAATVETALDRADYDQQLEAQNTELTHLNQVNDIIRAIDQGLVQAETREDIDQLVCEHLTASDLYECAWVGTADPTSGTVEPRAWAGVTSDYLDSLLITTDESSTGQHPVAAALRTREIQVVTDIVTDVSMVPWREQALDLGVRACISVPLCYNDALSGVLTVYADTPQPDSRETDVLAELGETIGRAITAVETKRTLQTDSVIELGLQLCEPDTVLGRLAQQTACTIEVEHLVPRTDGSPTVFFTTHGISADDLHRLGTDAGAIEDLICLTETDDTCLCKAQVSGATLATSFIEQNAMIRSLTIEESTVSAVVHLAQTADIRTFIDAIQAQFPSTELLSRRTRNRSLAREQADQMAFEEELTPRQQDVLRTAYMSGFFESPREHTGQEIADILGVSQPTFVEHLRASQRNLLSTLLDESN